MRVRKAIGIFVRNRKGRYLILKTTNKKIYNITLQKYWDIPKGGVKSGERLLTAVKRELKEELGTDKFKDFKRLGLSFYFNFPKKFSKKTRFNGQKVELFSAEFYGRKSDIKVDRKEIESFDFLEPKKFLHKLTYQTTRKSFSNFMKRMENLRQSITVPRKK